MTEVRKLASLLSTKSICGFRGVSWDHDRKSFFAMAYVDGRRKKRSGFATVVEAAVAYDKMAREIYGESARLNFPTKN